MNRFEYATCVAVSPEQEPLRSLATAFAKAVAEVEEEQRLPIEDPAVLLMGAFIAFHTHADVNTLSGYRKLIEACQIRISILEHPKH